MPVPAPRSGGPSPEPSSTSTRDLLNQEKQLNIDIMKKKKEYLDDEHKSEMDEEKTRTGAEKAVKWNQRFNLGKNIVGTGSSYLSKKASAWSLNFFVVMSLIVHFFDIDYNFDVFNVLRIVVHLFMAGLAVKTFPEKNPNGWKRFGYYSLWALAAIFSAWIGNGVAAIIHGINAPDFLVYFTNSFFTPIWFYYALFQAYKSSKMVSFFRFVILGLIWYLTVISLMSEVGSVATVLGIETEASDQQRVDFITKLKELWEAFLNSPEAIGRGYQSFTQSFQRGIDRQVAYATGDYYTGKVDKNEEEPLGVYIKNLKAADPEQYEDEPVTVWATLKARTLDEKDIVRINVSCVADKDSEYERLNGIMDPKNVFEVAAMEEEEIDCHFSKGMLEAGSHRIHFNANFNFETMAYLKSYFMDKERMRAMMREEIDIFDHYGVTEKKPIATYTNGPVGLGMEIQKTLPMGIDQNLPDETFTLGITLENNWEGEVLNVTDLIIILPNSMDLYLDEEDRGCYGYTFDEVGCMDIGQDEDSCDDSVSNIYRIIQGENLANIGNIKSFKSLRCPIRVDQGNFIDLLGDTPFSTKYFKVISRYIYELEEKTTIRVKEPEGFYVFFETRNANRDQGLICHGKHPERDLTVDYTISKWFDIDDEDEIIPEKTITSCARRDCKVHIKKDVLKGNEIVKGDIVKCNMIAHLKINPYVMQRENRQYDSIMDVGDDTESDYDKIILQNSPPKIKTIIFSNNTPVEGQNIQCIANVTDADDEINMSVQFLFDGIDMAPDTIDCRKLKDSIVDHDSLFNCIVDISGDMVVADKTIKCELTPYDGDTKGNKRSKVVKVQEPTVEAVDDET